MGDVSQVTSEELSVFYTDFLDKKYNDQMTFTRYYIILVVGAIVVYTF